MSVSKCWRIALQSFRLSVFAKKVKKQVFNAPLGLGVVWPLYIGRTVVTGKLPISHFPRNIYEFSHFNNLNDGVFC